MKITKIELKNFLGLYNGSGKKSITVDFTKGNDNKVTILSGGNGKGKSFLISCLHPFASTLDNRNKIIIEGENGYKEIHYDLSNDRKVIIKHHYNQGRNGKITMKSFFSLSEDNGKTFKELNPNGTVTSFKQLVLEHLEVDEAYFKIARVGTNVTNFIDMPTAERKKYISLFLPDVDIYLENYKKINEKYNALNKNIKFITQEINKLDDEDNLKSNLENAENTLNSLKSSLELLRKELNENIGQMHIIDPDGSVETSFIKDYNNFNSLKSLSNKYKSEITELEDSLKDDYTLDEITIELAKIEVEQTNLKNKVKELHFKLQSTESELEEKNTILYKMKLDTEDEINNILNSSKEKIDNLEKVLSSNEYVPLYQYSNIDNYEIRKAIDILDKYKTESRGILDNYDLAVINSVFDNEELISLNEINAEISSIKKEISNLEINKRTLMTKVELVDVLNSRPKACKIDTCPFISKALDYKNVEEDIKKLEESINEKNNILEKKEKEKEFINNASLLQCDITRLFKFIQSERDILSKLPYYNLYDTYENFMFNFRQYKDHLTDFKSILSMLELQQELKVEKSQYKVAEMKLNHIQELKDSADIVKRDIDRIENSIKETTEEITSVNNKIDDNIHIIEKYVIVKSKLEKLQETKNKLTETEGNVKSLAKSLNKMKDDINKLKKIKQSNKELTAEIEKIEKQLTPLEKEKERLSLNLRRLNDFHESKSKLEKDYYDLSVIRDALSNTKGIPLLFIELYLKKIKTIANELLDISFNGKFFIEDFIVTESDFFISVRKSEGELVGDISQASQGEQALTSIALSFALVQQSTRAYNVLALDEMDSTLDSNNRRAFIDVVEVQLKEMNVEQCFIISHNEAFDTYPANLILFEGTNVDVNDIEYMKNKKVLYQNK